MKAIFSGPQNQKSILARNIFPSKKYTTLYFHTGYVFAMFITAS